MRAGHLLADAEQLRGHGRRARGLCGAPSGHALQHRLALRPGLSRSGPLEQHRTRFPYLRRPDADSIAAPWRVRTKSCCGPRVAFRLSHASRLSCAFGRNHAFGLSTFRRGVRIFGRNCANNACIAVAVGMAHGSERPAAAGEWRRDTAAGTIGSGRASGVRRPGRLLRHRHSRLWESHHHQARREPAVRLRPQQRSIGARGPGSCARSTDRPHGRGSSAEAGAVLRNSPQRQTRRSTAVSSRHKVISVLVTVTY